MKGGLGGGNCPPLFRRIEGVAGVGAFAALQLALLLALPLLRSHLRPCNLLWTMKKVLYLLSRRPNKLKVAKTFDKFIGKEQKY